MPNQEAPRVIQTLGPNAQGFSFALEEFEGRVQLRALHRPDYGPIYADWLSQDIKRRIASGRKQLLAKAIGLHKKQNLSVLDATAGLGRDGFTLAALGAEVTMTERQSEIFSLLSDAFKRARNDPSVSPTTNRIQLINGDAIDVLHEQSWDVIYLDPMYPHLGKTALPQKEMQIFRDIMPDEQRSEGLLSRALSQARQRVVVKRSAKAPSLNAQAPTYYVEGEQTRFDVYITTPQP